MYNINSFKYHISAAYLFSLMICSFLLCSCNSFDTAKNNSEVRILDELTPSQFESHIKDNHLIDVRTPEEVNQGIIEGAITINYYDDDFVQQFDSLFGNNKSQELYLYCRSGGRSFKALNILKQYGFSNVHHLEGGIKSWNATILRNDKKDLKK
jgi:rhodanese-related sulfurtransferase